MSMINTFTQLIRVPVKSRMPKDDTMWQVLRPGPHLKAHAELTQKTVDRAVELIHAQWPSVHPMCFEISELIRTGTDTLKKQALILMALDRVPVFRDEMAQVSDGVRFYRLIKYLGASMCSYIGGMELYKYLRKANPGAPTYNNYLDFVSAMTSVYGCGGIE